MSLTTVTGILQAGGVIDSSFFTEEARLRGTAAHMACQYADEGTLDRDTCPPDALACADAWLRYLAESGATVARDWAGEPIIERRFYSRVYGFSGQLDRLIVTGRNEWAVADIKRGAPLPSIGLQLAGYTLLAQEAGWPVTRRLSIHLAPGAAVPYRVHSYDDHADREVFLALLEVQTWKNRHRIGI